MEEVPLGGTEVFLFFPKEEIFMSSIRKADTATLAYNSFIFPTCVAHCLS